MSFQILIVSFRETACFKEQKYKRTLFRPNPLQYFLVPDIEVENGGEDGEEEELEDEEEIDDNVVVMEEEDDDVEEEEEEEPVEGQDGDGEEEEVK